MLLSRRGRIVAGGMGVAVMLAGTAVAAAPSRVTSRQAAKVLAASGDPTRLTLPRAGAAAPLAGSTRDARAGLRSSLGRQGVVTVDDQTGGLKAVGRLDGFLTGASSADAQSIALGYVRSHAPAFGLSA